MTDAQLETYLSRKSDSWCKQLTGNCTACHIRYTGEYCETDVLDNVGFMTLLLLYQVGFFSVYFLAFLWTIIGIVERVVNKLGLFNIYGGVIILVLVYTVTRFYHFVDPFGFYELTPPTVELFIYWLGIISISTALTLSISLWLDIVSTYHKDSSNFRNAKTISAIVAIVFWIIFVLMLIVFSIFGSVGTGVLLCKFATFAVLVLLVVLSFAVLPRVAGVVKSMKGATKLDKVSLRIYLILAVALFKMGSWCIWYYACVYGNIFAS